MKACKPLLYSLAAAACLAALPATPALAAYPERPITLIVNYPPGGLLDIVARQVANDASKQLGQTIVVENRAGAAGQVGGQYAARQPADGYSVLLTVDTLYTVNPFVYSKDADFDARKELEPVTMAGTFNLTLLSHPSLGVKSLDEFIEKAKATDLTYSSAGIGSPGHLTMEYFNQQVDGKLIHVPYQGNAPATNGLLSGQTDAAFIAIGGAIQFVNSDRLIPLAVSGAERDPLMPEVPTVAESGLEGLTDFDVEFGFTLMVPKGTPADIQATWSEVMEKAFATPEVRERMNTMNLRPLAGSPEDTRTRLDRIAAQWEGVIQRTSLSRD